MLTATVTATATATESPEVATGTLCCWCDAVAVHNLEHFFDVACTVHFVLYYADGSLGLATPTR